MKTCLSKQSLCGLFVVIALGIAALWWIKVHPKAHPILRIARINSTRIKNEAEPFVRVKSWFEKQCQHTQTDLTNKIQELQRTYEWLKIAPKDQKMRERHDGFRKEVAVLERIVQDRKENLTQQFATISSFLEDKLKQVITKLAHDKNVSLVMNQNIHEVQAILYADDQVVDLTDDVITYMNQETTNLHLPESATVLTPPPGSEESKGHSA